MSAAPVVFTKRVRPARDVLYQKVADESVILNLSTEKYHGFDAVGTRMWEVLTNADSIQQASDELCDEYEVDRERLERDLQGFVSRLLEHGLAEVSDG